MSSFLLVSMIQSYQSETQMVFVGQLSLLILILKKRSDLLCRAFFHACCREVFGIDVHNKSMNYVIIQ